MQSPSDETSHFVGFVFYCLIFDAASWPVALRDTIPRVHTANEVGNIAGFWRGLWHGMICPIMFIVPLFSDNVSIYEIRNNGGWYNFGFLLGAGSSLGSSGASASRSRK
ncbi:hypothetical protein KGQ27_01995 [Patescibacteria group bacterium]|nr:hypothetical protein [Patescibacteria group bacterium]MDE1946310.1 hypothetical protein [Patescibacteria group bacterium]MDE2010762.1 hypothetical protein [Patescibacteria group bacterium]MDE2232647.1 hypothetical protein [Patescibacteria group bacterium]